MVESIRGCRRPVFDAMRVRTKVLQWDHCSRFPRAKGVAFGTLGVKQLMTPRRTCAVDRVRVFRGSEVHQPGLNAVKARDIDGILCSPCRQRSAANGLRERTVEAIRMVEQALARALIP